MASDGTVEPLSQSLLLLPPPPRPASREALDAAYRASLSAVLSRLSSSAAESGAAASAVLVVAVACPVLDLQSKAVRWNAAQSLLAGLYTIISSVCADHSIPVDVGADHGGVDARIVLIDYEHGRTYSEGLQSLSNGTIILDIAAFASGVHSWQTIFHPSSESGYDLLTTYLKFAEGKQTILQSQLVEVESGLSLSTGTGKTLNTAGDEHSGDERSYEIVCLGGTFDHLHPGHKLLLHATALLLKVPEKDGNQPCQLIIGISGDALLKNKKYAEELQPWSHRALSALSVLATILDASTTTPTVTNIPATADAPDELHATLRNGTVLLRCVNIPDPFGPTITEEAIKAIVVSGETRSGGSAINDKRRDKGWNPLEVYEIDVLDARGVGSEAVGGAGAGSEENFDDKISSTAIRRQRAEARAGGR